MKKFFTIVFSLLLFACAGGESVENTADTDAADAQVTEEAPIIEEAKFVALSAQILCLPTNNPEATPEEVETQAKDLINQAGITQEEFTTYQASIENSADDKQRLSMEIMREMEVYCDADAAMSDAEEIVSDDGTKENTVQDSGEVSEPEADTADTSGATENTVADSAEEPAVGDTVETEAENNTTGIDEVGTNTETMVPVTPESREGETAVTPDE